MAPIEAETLTGPEVSPLLAGVGRYLLTALASSFPRLLNQVTYTAGVLKIILAVAIGLALGLFVAILVLTAIFSSG